MIRFEDMQFACHWDGDRICRNHLMCGGCEYQPPPEDKVNGKAPPLPLDWAPDFTGRGMGWPLCPACGEMPYSTERCIFCGQRFLRDQRVMDYEEPPYEERRDCPLCGTMGAMVGTRAKSNGHFRGICENCGARVME